MNFKKNKLIILIILAMVLGIIIGSIINSSITGSRLKVDRTQLNKIENPKVRGEVEKLAKKYEETQLSSAKKDIAGNYSILSDIFLRMIKMIIAPLVFAVLVIGVAKLGDFKSVGRIGVKTLVYFTSATLIALALGLVIVNIFEPGKKMDISSIDQTASTGVKPSQQTAKNFISHVIPDSVVGAMANNEILPIVVFALFFGIAAASIKEQGKFIVDACESLGHVMFKVTNYVMSFAPIGVFGAITAVVIQQGVGLLGGYIYLIACFFGGLLFFVFVVLFLICKVFKIKFFALMKDVKEPLLLAFSTASSESAMPKTIEALEKHGISNRIVSFVLPLGYSFNLDGSIMYMTFATMFIAQSYGMDLTAGDQIKMMLILLVTSKGMAGIPRASLVVIAGTLSMFNIPQEGLLLLLGIDQLLDMGRSATNVVGNAVASAVVARLEGEKF
ncbi:MAG: dicarboxylate/amino acid:cation symporter [Sphingobacteriaceae bacterium]|nr:dicarboxylate/amino acid:cation symporter [Sphingobacteriaceae bacterium]